MKISNDIKYVGVNDRNLDLFEGQYVVENGMAYNSYVIIDEKVAVMDSVDRSFGAEWLENIAVALNGRTPDYLVVQHMEPDHSSNILAFSENTRTQNRVVPSRVPDDEKLFRHGFSGQTSRGERRRRFAARKTQPVVYRRSHGTLARSHNDLRRL